MQKEKKLKMGFEHQKMQPAHIPSELLDIAPCQVETIFTYLYIEVLRFVAKLP